MIHSGSRNLGNRVAKYYQKKAYDYYIRTNNEFEEDSKKFIEKYKKENREDEIQDALIKLKEEHNFIPKIAKDLCYLEGKLMEDYLHDMNIIQKYAELNRDIMAKRIIEDCIGLKFNDLEHFQTIHNYIEIENRILRKGAIAAYEGRKLLIPINMRDGVILGVGKGTLDWINSAPHDAGRILSRGEAKRSINMKDYKDSMKNIFTTSVNINTIDEAPQAYKPIDEIIENIRDTVDIIKILKPIYNLKSN
ncbi:RtcB family protein [Clostridioides sp. ES-S-0108-01]|uniref:RtcB family protein n=1 Tax=Clostridioides sp. ES-S-0108-01 TaxID=2770773 RepID=UPI0039BD160D